MAGANEGKNKLKGIHKSPLSSPFPSPIGTCNAGWSEISACKKVVVFFSDFFQASELKREASEDSSPSRVLALHACFAF